jgi:hypothetical protein
VVSGVSPALRNNPLIVINVADCSFIAKHTHRDHFQLFQNLNKSKVQGLKDVNGMSRENNFQHSTPAKKSKDTF